MLSIDTIIIYFYSGGGVGGGFGDSGYMSGMGGGVGMNAGLGGGGGGYKNDNGADKVSYHKYNSS